MSIKKILDEVAPSLFIEKAEASSLKEWTKKIVEAVQEELKKGKVNAEVFLGGSYSKNTLIKGDFYDVDVFVRFDWKYENISPILSNVLNKMSKKMGLKLEKLHGSRDYF